MGRWMPTIAAFVIVACGATDGDVGGKSPPADHGPADPDWQGDAKNAPDVEISSDAEPTFDAASDATAAPDGASIDAAEISDSTAIGDVVTEAADEDVAQEAEAPLTSCVGGTDGSNDSDAGDAATCTYGF